MRAVSLIALPLALLALLAVGCQTDKRGVQVDVGAALRAYRQRLDRRPGRAEVERMVAVLGAEQLNDLGVLYEREGRLDKAAWAYQHAVWRNPRLALAYLNLGNVLRKQGKTEEALLRYRQAMNADPRSLEAANNFADLCAEQRVHLEEAVARLAPLVAAPGPQRAYGLDSLGWLYHLQAQDLSAGRTEEERAAETLEAALRESDPGRPELRLAIHQHLAVVYAALGRDREAASHQAEARRISEQVKASPGGASAGEALQEER